MNRSCSSAPARFPLRSMAAVLLLGSAIVLPLAGTCAENVARTAGAVTYVSGGIGDASLDELKSTSKNYNLKLVFALYSGAFMDNVIVAITDAGGRQVLDTTSEGPWLLAKLPAGSYRVVATSSGKAITQQAAIDPKKLKTLNFRWASE